MDLTLQHERYGSSMSQGALVSHSLTCVVLIGTGVT